MSDMSDITVSKCCNYPEEIFPQSKNNKPFTGKEEFLIFKANYRPGTSPQQ